MSEVLVIMPFGRRAHVQGSATLETDFDSLYHELIKPAITASGNAPLRIDEVIEAGDINSQYLNRIVSADLVIAELSMPNGNVYYELGIRQSLSARPNILMAEANTELPFDIRNQRVLFYRWSTEGDRAKTISILTQWIGEVAARSYVNPVHQYLKLSGLGVDPSDALAFERDFRGKIERAKTPEQLNAVWTWAKAFDALPPFALLDLAQKFSLTKDWKTAADITHMASVSRPNDYELHRILGWYLRNAGEQYYGEAEREFREALNLNSGDLESLGMLGGLLKRQKRYAEAAEHYGRGIKEAPGNLYISVAHAGLTLLASPGPDSPALQLYRDLLALCAAPEKARDPWALAVAGEANFVLGNDNAALANFQEAGSVADSPTILVSPADQLALFADAGYRPEQALSLESQLRALAAHVTAVAIGGSTPAAPSRSPGLLPVLVHLSDPHFGHRFSADGKKIEMHRFCGDDDYSISLTEHILNEFNQKRGRFRFNQERLIMVISGDIAYQARSDEYKDALACFNALATSLPISKERIVFCPGNHDVNWTDSKADRTKRFDNYLSFLLEFYGEDLFRTLYPFVSWDFRVNSPRPDSADIIGVATLPEQGVEIYSFNSCVYETEQHHYGFVGGKQLRKVETLLASTLGVQPVRVAILHHHIHPYPEHSAPDASGAHPYDASTVRDAGLFERFLEKHYFDIVLHGHKHKPQLRETSVQDGMTSVDLMKYLIVCGAGSCSVDPGELEHAVPNHYQVIELLSESRPSRSEFLKVEWRELAVTPDAEWTTRRVWTVQG